MMIKSKSTAFIIIICCIALSIAIIMASKSMDKTVGNMAQNPDNSGNTAIPIVLKQEEVPNSKKTGSVVNMYGKYYMLGEEMILGDSCTQRLKGTLTAVTSDKFSVKITEQEKPSPGDANKYDTLSDPYVLDVIDGYFLKSTPPGKCVDATVEGTEFKLLQGNLTPDHSDLILGVMTTQRGTSNIPKAKGVKAIGG